MDDAGRCDYGRSVPLPPYLQELPGTNLIRIISSRRAFSVDFPIQWQFTRVQPSDTAPDIATDFGFAVDARPQSDPDSWIGVWFNRIGPQAASFPQMQVLAHDCPPFEFDRFADLMRANTEAQGGRELSRQAGLSLGGVPAGEYQFEPLEARVVRIRAAWANGKRYSVFFASNPDGQRRFAREFEALADSFRIALAV